MSIRMSIHISMHKSTHIAMHMSTTMSKQVYTHMFKAAAQSPEVTVIMQLSNDDYFDTLMAGIMIITLIP